MADFSDWPTYHHRHPRQFTTPSRAFVFRREVDTYTCDADWAQVAPEVLAWAAAHDIVVAKSGQCIFVLEDQPDFANKVLMFKVRWC